MVAGAATQLTRSVASVARAATETPHAAAIVAFASATSVRDTGRPKREPSVPSTNSRPKSHAATSPPHRTMATARI